MQLDLEITRPIVFFDLETTGVDVNKDRIIEIYAIKFHPDKEPEEFYYLINPSSPISAEATEKHGFTNEMLQDKPKFSDIVEDLLNIFGEADLGGHNSNHFDIQMLAAEFKRAGYGYDLSKVLMIDTRKIYMKYNPKELSNIYSEYTGKDLENAHSAKADVLATIEIFNEQVKKHDLKSLKDIDTIGKTDKKGNRFLDLDGKFIKTKENKYLYNFGKHIGQEVSLENLSFIGWMLGTDFSEDTKRVAKTLQDYILKISQKK